MPLYRFEITQGASTRTIEVDCRDQESMRVEALRMAAAAIKDLRESFWKQPLWAVRITDDTNMTILSLKFSADL